MKVNIDVVAGTVAIEGETCGGNSHAYWTRALDIADRLVELRARLELDAQETD